MYLLLHIIPFWIPYMACRVTCICHQCIAHYSVKWKIYIWNYIWCIDLIWYGIINSAHMDDEHNLTDSHMFWTRPRRVNIWRRIKEPSFILFYRSLISPWEAITRSNFSPVIHGSRCHQVITSHDIMIPDCLILWRRISATTVVYIMCQNWVGTSLMDQDWYWPSSGTLSHVYRGAIKLPLPEQKFFELIFPIENAWILIQVAVK